ncbi:hypothetical protein BOC60_20320 [Burkholderia pseudomallei]|nr:hypothetical protein BOC60_20320 [Burkholderia pseudomallei]
MLGRLRVTICDQACVVFAGCVFGEARISDGVVVRVAISVLLTNLRHQRFEVGTHLCQFAMQTWRPIIDQLSRMLGI